MSAGSSALLTNGNMGLAPTLKGVSDVVTILGGGRIPFVLHLWSACSDWMRYLDANFEGRNSGVCRGCRLVGDIFRG
jgi:hypothetical protein